MASEPAHENTTKAHGAALPPFLTEASGVLRYRFRLIQSLEQMQMASGNLSEDQDHFRRLPSKDNMMDMNRYYNITPFDYNRVRLQVPFGQHDYVNASNIDLNLELTATDDSKLHVAGRDDTQLLHYIAMQGPTEQSFDSVWRMLAEQNAPTMVIIQLTAMVERDVLKCDQYFPTEPKDGTNTWIINQTDQWRDGWQATLSVEGAETLDAGAVVKTKLRLKVQTPGTPQKNSSERSVLVWHLLYTRWPDFGVPSHADLPSFCHLIALSRQLTPPESRRIVHCSAGVGRTGTFIAIDRLALMLETGRLRRCALQPFRLGYELDLDPVFQTVCQLREQRRFMVQGDTQYCFIYEVLAALWARKYSNSPAL